MLAEVGKLYSSIANNDKLLQCVDTAVPPGMNACTLVDYWDIVLSTGLILFKATV